MTVDRGVQPGVRQQAAQALDVSRRLASLERAAGSGGGGGGGGIPEAPLDGQQYGRQSGAWTVVDSSGSVWHVGSGAPAVGLGANGDFYLDEATGDVYEKSSGVWSLVANITGPQGEQGEQGEQGDPGVDGLGWTGGSYDDSDGTVTFTSDDGLGFSTGDLRGTDGLDGATWHVGSGDPDPALGEVGDYFLDGTAGWVWVKRSSGWTNLGVNLIGPPGPGIEDAPSDGDQYARQDGAWTVVSGGGFEGEHVLTGDPENPPAELDAGQLLWDGVEGGGGGGGPHDHDYLPLTGGTLTGDLRVDGTVKLPNARSAEPMNTAPPNTYITSNGNVTFTDYSIADEIDTAVENAWRTPLTSASPADWNDATTPGWAGLILDSAPNGFASRSSGYFHCQVTNYGYTDNLTQTAIPYSLGSDGPAEMWVRTRYNGNWSAWTCVGGAQTGYVSEKGHYRKHADGTLECWLRYNLPSVPIDAAYGSLFLGSMSWVFPHAFSDDRPTVTVGSAQWGSSASWGALYTTSAASATLRLFDVVARDASRSILTNVYAIGRWYALGATFDVDAEPPPEETEQDRRDRELEALNVEGA